MTEHPTIRLRPGPGKPQLSRARRFLRLLGSVIDPRAWGHLLKLVNFYNYAHVLPLRQITRGESCWISPTATFFQGPRIHLGARVLIGENCRLWAGHGAAEIRIGDDTMLGPNILITASSYRFRAGGPISRQPMDEADVIIGRDVWLGAGVVVLAGARIGDGAVIGANSVVRGTVPSGTVYAGSPARRIGQRFPDPPE